MKIQPDHDILVPMDFSEFCAKTIKYALHHFPVEKIRLIHVAQRPVIASPGGFEALTDETILGDSVEAMKEFYARNNLPEELRYVIEIGNPAEKIAAYAKNHPVDVIVISSHGRRGISRFFLGSVAEQVVRLAPCPVLVYKADAIQKDCTDNLDEIESASTADA